MAATALDLTPYQNMTQEQFISSVHKLTAVPSLVILWFFTMVVVFGCGLMVNNKSKYYTIAFLVLISSGIMLCALIFLPNVVHDFAAWFHNFFF